MPELIVDPAIGDEDNITRTVVRFKQAEGAEWMRLGNTPYEAQMANWIPFSNSVRHDLIGATYNDGLGTKWRAFEKRVYAELLMADGRIVTLSGEEPARTPTTNALEETWEFENLLDSRVSDYLIYHDFLENRMHWMTYGDFPRVGNIFYPQSYSQYRSKFVTAPDTILDSTDRANRAGFIWTDPSRWQCDSGEFSTTSSISYLVGMLFVRDALRSRYGGGTSLDLDAVDVFMDLFSKSDWRGQTFASNVTDISATLYMWFVGPHSDGIRRRWWYTGSVLGAAAGGSMTANSFTLSTSAANWVNSFAENGNPLLTSTVPSLNTVEQVGYGFIRPSGDGATIPRGVLGMDFFALR